MEELNVLIDVSHLSEKSFWDVLGVCNKPIIASHSCIYALCGHPRNLRDNQIRQIARLNGTIGVNIYNKFLADGNKCDIKKIVEHIEYIVSLVGIDYVGIGTDFDGIPKEGKPEGINTVADIYKIFEELEKRGYCQEDIDKIAGLNHLRLLL